MVFCMLNCLIFTFDYSCNIYEKSTLLESEIWIGQVIWRGAVKVLSLKTLWKSRKHSRRKYISFSIWSFVADEQTDPFSEFSWVIWCYYTVTGRKLKGTTSSEPSHIFSLGMLRLSLTFRTKTCLSVCYVVNSFCKIVNAWNITNTLLWESYISNLVYWFANTSLA